MDIKESFNVPEEFVAQLSEEQWEELQLAIEHLVSSDHGFVEADRNAVQTLVTGAWLSGSFYQANWMANHFMSEPEDDGLIHLTLNNVQAKNLIQFFLGEQA